MRKESESKVTMPDGDQFVWVSRPSCTLQQGGGMISAKVWSSGADGVPNLSKVDADHGAR